MRVPFPSMSITRHFTATGFVVHDGHVLLHWHPKVKAWLPPGGHIDENEDPVQAVVREIEEESGVTAEVVMSAPPIELDYPTQVAPPFTIMVEDIHDPVNGYHQLDGSRPGPRVRRDLARHIQPHLGRDRDRLIHNLAQSPPPRIILNLLSLPPFDGGRLGWGFPRRAAP